MPDTFTSTTHTSYGSRIMNSIKGIVGSVILFLGSFVLLYWNEGRVDLSTIARRATPVEATAAASLPDGQLIAASGKLTAASPLEDGFALKPGPYVAIYRTAEMYAWVEETKSETKKNMGGSEDTTTTVTYKKEWTSHPEETADFQHPEGHENPVLDPGLSATVFAPDTTVGPLAVNPEKFELRGSQDLQLTDAHIAALPEGFTRQGKYLVTGTGTQQAPQVGDVRISYAAIPSGLDVTAFGAKTGTSVTPFVDLDKTGETLALIFPGTQAEAIKALHDEYTMWTWILRVVGFLLMWGGLNGIIAVVSVLLDVLPFLGDISRAMLGLVTFVIALVLSIVTILVSMLLHSPIALAITAVIAIGAIWWYLNRKKGVTSAPRAPS